MATPPPSASTIEADLARLESGIKQLKVQYDMFFAGGLPREPVELRIALEKLVRHYRNASIQKYHHRFHLNALISRFNIMAELWGKNVRSLEEGNRPAPAIHDKGPFREKLVARCKISDPAADQTALRDLFRKFGDARRRAGAEREIGFDQFVRGISSQTDRLRKSSGCAEIELRVVVNDQKVQLKARPGR